MVRRTKEEAQETRDEILNAAAIVFCDKGFANSSLEDIAKAANVTRGAIYWHFKNKNDIFEALHDQLRCPLVEILLRDLENDHPDPVKQLKENCTNLLLDLITNHHQRRILMLFMQKSDYSGELANCKEAHNENKEEHLNIFAEYFDRAKEKSPALREFDTNILAVSISCFLKGIIIEYLNNSEKFDMQKNAPAMMNIFFKGLK